MNAIESFPRVIYRAHFEPPVIQLKPRGLRPSPCPDAPASGSSWRQKTNQVGARQTLTRRQRPVRTTELTAAAANWRRCSENQLWRPERLGRPSWPAWRLWQQIQAQKCRFFCVVWRSKEHPAIGAKRGIERLIATLKK